jgi:hypothetical protein
LNWVRFRRRLTPVENVHPKHSIVLLINNRHERFSKTFQELNQSGMDFLLTDVDLAMTFMDVAAASHDQETVHRNHNNARKAYDTVLHLLGKMTLTAGKREEINAKLAVLKTRLQVMGQQF